MSHLIIANDLNLMMLEFSIDKVILYIVYCYKYYRLLITAQYSQLLIPKPVNKKIIRKTTVMFRLLDHDWLQLIPQANKQNQHTSSTNENELFHGGKSMVFAYPIARLQHKVSNVDIEVRICQDFYNNCEWQSTTNVEITRIQIDQLFNAILKELWERKDMHKHYNYFHKREPISR